MVHQILREGTQGPKALIRDALRPEDSPRVVAEGDGDDCEPEQAAPLEVAGACGRPHRCSDPTGWSLASSARWPGRGERFPVHQTRKVLAAVIWGPSLGLFRCRRHLSISVRIAAVLPP